jgi:hypothetical protein
MLASNIGFCKLLAHGEVLSVMEVTCVIYIVDWFTWRTFLCAKLETMMTICRNLVNSTHKLVASTSLTQNLPFTQLLYPTRQLGSLQLLFTIIWKSTLGAIRWKEAIPFITKLLSLQIYINSPWFGCVKESTQN